MKGNIMQKLLEELDGAYLVRYVNNLVFVWHGGEYVNIFDMAGNIAGTLNFSYCDDVYQLEDELSDHFVDMGYFPKDESGEEVAQ